MANEIPKLNDGREFSSGSTASELPDDRRVGSTLRSIASAQGHDQPGATISSSSQNPKSDHRRVGPTLAGISPAQGSNRSYGSVASSRLTIQAGNQTLGVSHHVNTHPMNMSTINTGFEQQGMAAEDSKYNSKHLPPEIRDRKYKFTLCPTDLIAGADPWNSLAHKEWKLPRPPLQLSTFYGGTNYEDILKYLSVNTYVVARGDVAETLEWILDLPEDIRKLMKKVVFKPSSMDLSRQSRELPRAKVDLHLQKVGAANFPVPKRYKMLHVLELRALEKVWQAKYEFLTRLDHIEQLTFDFTEMQCPNRCCTPGKIALPAMRRIGAYGPNLPRRWRIQGVRDYGAFKDIVLGMNVKRSELLRGEFLCKYA